LDNKAIFSGILKQCMKIWNLFNVKCVHPNLDVKVALMNTSKQFMKITNLSNATSALYHLDDKTVFSGILNSAWKFETFSMSNVFIQI
jgi:hypothetical protein